MAEPSVIDFESAYQRTLPRIPLTEAHRLVEQIRAKLVAGTVDLSLRFDHPFSDTDPSILEFIDQTAEAAEVNLMATERRTSRYEG